MVGVHAVRAESSSIDRLVVEQLAFRWTVVCINIVVSVAAVGLDGEGERRPGRGWSVSCYDVEGALEINQFHAAPLTEWPSGLLLCSWICSSSRFLYIWAFGVHGARGHLLI